MQHQTSIPSHIPSPNLKSAPASRVPFRSVKIASRDQPLHNLPHCEIAAVRQTVCRLTLKQYHSDSRWRNRGIGRGEQPAGGMLVLVVDPNRIQMCIAVAMIA